MDKFTTSILCLEWQKGPPSTLASEHSSVAQKLSLARFLPLETGDVRVCVARLTQKQSLVRVIRFLSSNYASFLIKSTTVSDSSFLLS